MIAQAAAAATKFGIFPCGGLLRAASYIAAAVAFFATTAAAQVTVDVKKSLVGVTKPEIVGDRIFVGADSNPSVSDVAVVSVDPAWKFQLLKFRRDGQRFQADKLTDTQWIVVGKGKYELAATLFDPEKGIFDDEYSFELGGSPGPKPPEPTPPEPGPSPAPIVETGFRVLVVYETADLASMSRDQQLIFSGPEVRGYLDSHCVKVNGTPEWRFFDKDTQFPVTCDSVWCKTMKRARGDLPWIVVSDGKTGYEGPLPPDVRSTLDLLRKWGK